MSKAFLVQGDEWEFCREKAISCVFAVEGQSGCATCKNAEVLERELYERLRSTSIAEQSKEG